MSKKVSRFIGIMFALTLTGAGCISFQRGGAALDGGMFKSVNAGQEWQQKAVLPTAGGIKSLAGVNVASLAIDPQDHLAIYAGTRESGLFYSYDAAESWSQAKDLRSGRVAAIAVDPKDKCTIFAAIGNRLMKSVDCSRTFEESYREPTSDALINTLTVDRSNPNVVYLGVSKGTVLKSTDGGRSWATLKAFNNRIVDIVIDPRIALTLYVGTANKGVFRSNDGGGSFTDLSAPMRKFDGGAEVRRLIADSATPDALIAATRYGILRTTDGGVTWTPFTLVTQPGKIEILSLAVNPRSSNEIYYGTATTFYRSTDGGKSWSTKKLPTSRTATALLVDFQSPQTIYLGVTEIKK